MTRRTFGKIVTLAPFVTRFAIANPSLVSHAIGTSPTGTTAPAVTSAINSTGASLLVAYVANYLADSSTPGSVVDSKGNTWIALTNFQQTPAINLCCWYCLTPNVGSGHTVTVTNNYPAVAFSAWSGVLSFSDEAAPGPVTPTQAGDLLISGYSDATGNAVISVDSGFSIFDSALVGGNYLPLAVASLIAPNTSAVTPTWTSTALIYASSVIQFVKSASSAAQTSSPIIY